ncbi:hypothetical protein [Streptomyces sp. NBC_01180]|uniref:hypothetical protein n=1 Tax=unclassified Streptomyces TaxID=2593676 RepID=UPI0038636BB9
MSMQQNRPVQANASTRQIAKASPTTAVTRGATGVDEPADARGNTSIADALVVEVAGVAGGPGRV